MNLDAFPMPPSYKRQAQRLVARIRNADTMLETVKRGALAEGFVLGLATAEAMDPMVLEQLDILFSRETDDQLMVLSR